MTNKLPYWADQYLQNMEAYRPSTYAELKAAGTLESTALEIQEAANAFYQEQKSSLLASGYSATQADVEATGSTMRAYILVAPEDEDDPFLDDDDPFTEEIP